MTRLFLLLLPPSSLNVLPLQSSCALDIYPFINHSIDQYLFREMLSYTFHGPVLDSIHFTDQIVDSRSFEYTCDVTVTVVCQSNPIITTYRWARLVPYPVIIVVLTITLNYLGGDK